MPSTTVTVGSAEGLHARPAGIIAEAAEKYETDIEIVYGEEEADAASAMLIMALGAEKGAQVTVSGENADAVAEIAALIEQDLDAE
ncbi:HPr family phosphocarrier protein [Dietzia sp. ANT_WB102]|uniref:HPr family phosphocarrier protein n=1 Tax=Dietzia sp. ANT_WB102 TaxID=2597345 RepID=UPI0011ED9B2C|nr:HPr family phosphocarrier protein [Dietzia sp. ANT_WB102]KAA0918451.1 HPr family phosphocarrier protein [Dietzia sp. ANT_WB102]